MYSWQYELPTHGSHWSTYTIRPPPSSPHCFQSMEESCFAESKFHCMYTVPVGFMWNPELNPRSYVLWLGTKSCTWTCERHASYLTISQVFCYHRKRITRSLNFAIQNIAYSRRFASPMRPSGSSFHLGGWGSCFMLNGVWIRCKRAFIGGDAMPD